jgi:hypothetical protein
MPILILIIIITIIGIAIFIGTRRNFDERKSRIMNLYSSVLSDMNIDFRDGRAHAVNIHDISQSILNLANEIENTAKHINQESPDNQKWLTDIILEFNTQLRLWIDRHTDELETIEDTIRNTGSEKPSEKSILELTHTRLESHRHILEKI